jgi:small-conductance mechanosensitive channel
VPFAGDAVAPREAGATLRKIGKACYAEETVTFWEITFYGNAVRDWLIALVIVLVAFAVLQAMRWAVVKNLDRLAARTRGGWDDVLANTLRRTTLLFLLFLSVYAGSRALVLTPGVQYGGRVIGVIVMAVQLALWGNVLITATIRRQMTQRLESDAAAATTINALGFLGRLLLYTVLLLLALDNLGVDITALVTGLGVGGIAVALALQNILGDLFASLSIVLDKPFVIGDFIIVGDMLGTVEYIGLKTTRIRSLSGEQLVFANGDLLGSRIRNFKRMFQRRVVFTVGVTYQTPRPVLERMPAMIRAAIEAQDMTRFDRAHFARYGASSLDFETVYYVLDPDYNRYMDIQQAVNLDIHRRFEEAGIDFAYPTQTLYVYSAGTS